ncbi:PAS-domain containing protein [Roseateles cavernae]|uniref:PAS-domain containing protein n=1 Tax=Roseateles cavernae TaxID=3153578 RepID=UPI0032E3A8AB
MGSDISRGGSGAGSASADPLALLRAVAQALDGLDIGACLFDEADRTLLWNRSFLTLFPEHAAHIQVGEPYSTNLRRFYEGRLNAFEMPLIERYIEKGVARHRLQNRPFAFEHGGRWLTAASLPLPGVGRIRLWRAGEHAVPQGGPIAVPEGLFSDGVALFDHVADGVMVTDADGQIAWVNHPFVLMYGLRDRAVAAGTSFESVYRRAWQGREGSDGEGFRRGLSTLAESLRFTGAPFELPLPEGRWARVIEQRGPDGKGFSAHVDITALKHQQQALEQAEARARASEARLKEKSTLLEATLARMEQGIMMVNAERVVEVCNRRAIELLGLPEDLMASKPSFEAVLAHQWASDEFSRTPQDIQDFVRSGGILDRAHCYDRQRPDGRVIEVRSVPIEGGGVLRTYTDVTERTRSEERVRHAARHDGLTSLVNRETFLECLAAAVRDSGCGAPGFAIHYIDLDGFKPINDRYGHAVGDKMLALAAERMRQIARDGDVVARMGGDEFAILQYGVDAADRGLGLARRILEGVAQPADIETLQLQVGASVGIALYPGAGADPDTLLRNADSAMYGAKAQGGQRVRVFGEG